MVKENKAALELSIGTIVIVILSVAMLTLGVILIGNIFDSAEYNIGQIDGKVRERIGELFPTNEKIYVHLPNKLAITTQGETWGIAFAIKNDIEGTPNQKTFTYEITPSSAEEIQENCDIQEEMVRQWIQVGRKSTFDLQPGDTYVGLVRIHIPEAAPLCTIRFDIVVTNSEGIYATDFFDIEITN